MTPTEKRIRQALQEANPVNDDAFCETLRRAMLLYNEGDELPEAVATARAIHTLWDEVQTDPEARPCTRTIVRVPGTIFHALVTEALCAIEQGRDIAWEEVAEQAERLTMLLFRQREQEVGKEALARELREAYLKAAVSLAKNGDNSQALYLLGSIVALTRLADEERKGWI